jgi:Nucleotidyltransferase domain
VTTWDEVFTRWSKPPSETEEARAERAARMVRESLREHAALNARDFDIVAVGSYRNNTNVQSASDVDLAAVLRSAVYNDFPADGSITRESVGLGAATYELPQFRADVSRALRERFRSSDVGPGKLTLTIDEGSARLSADVTPYLLHRRYRRALSNGTIQTYDGIETRPSSDPNRRIVQWPEQTYAAGVTKNEATNRRYKRVVRILKCLRSELANARKPGGDAKSCFIEHAVFNAPETSFNKQESSYYEDVKSLLTFLWNAARDGRAKEFVEVSGMEWLFRPSETWTPALLEGFALSAWQHVGFK